MSLLSIKHVFGIESSQSNSIFYLDEDCYLYRSRRHIILYNIDYKCQRLIPYGNEFDKLEYLSVSPNKEYLGIVLNTLNKCRIIIYNINGTITRSIRRTKILSLKQTIRSTHVLSIVFSNNSKFVVALYGAPDYILVCWSIDQLKSVGIISLHIDLPNNPLNLQISFNPIDSSEMLITGNHLFRQYRLNNGRFSAHGQGLFQRYQSLNITCHSWLNENHILLGLNTGFISIIDKHGEVLQRYNVIEAGQPNNLLHRSSNALSSDRSHFQSLSDVNISKMVSNSQFSSTLISNKSLLSTTDIEQNPSNSTRSLHDNNPDAIICLLTFSHGVFVSTGRGCVIMYQRNENNGQLTYLRKLILPSSNLNDFSGNKIPNKLNDTTNSLYKQESNEVIRSLSLSPNEETLLVGTNNNHLYKFSFSKIDYTKNEPNILTQALDDAHIGAIRTGIICIRKPILLTLGIDRSLKIWNLQTNHQELNHQFVDEPLSISIHPTAIFICVAFSNIVRISVYTIDGLTPFKELEICNARIIEYSHQGHILAIAYDSILQFHHHYDYDQPTYGRANTKKFRLIRWSRDDAFIISVDFDDLVIQWDPYTGQRLSEYRIGDFSVHDLLISSDNKLAYLLTSDHKVKQFLLMTTIRDINIPFDDCIPTALSINDQTNYLFIGSQKGSIYSINLAQSNSMNDTNTSLELSQMNVHQGAVTQILISYENDLVISMGEDGNIIIYYLNIHQQNKDSNIIFREEILAKEVILKEQSIQLNYLIKRQMEITREHQNKIQIKEEEYIEHLDQLHIYCQSHINTMERKFSEFQQQKSSLKSEHEEQLNELIEEKQNSLNEYVEEKSKYYKQIILRDQLLKSNIRNLKQNENKQTNLTNNSYQRNIELIHLSYRDKLNNIKKKFSQEHIHINERINSLEEMKDIFDEDNQFELTNLHQIYQTKLRTILDQIEQLENEQVLFKTRLKQLDEESNDYENQIKQFQIERNKLVNNIEQINKDFILAKQTIEQRHFIIQEKLKRTNQMENRRDQLEKFSYVFNYQIRELTSEISPRQHQINALIEQFNHMDNEYHFLTQNNSKYSIQIDDYKTRLKSIQKELIKETIDIRKLNQTRANINEDFKLSYHLIDQPKQLIQIIRNIYGKYILYINTNINFFDCDRQRNYFEKSNQRLQIQISNHFEKDQIQQIKRIEEIIHIMRQISSYSFQLVELERILSDLDILSNIKTKINATTSKEIINAITIEQRSHFVQQKQSEFNSILDKQRKRIQQLRDYIQILEKHLQQTSQQCGTELRFPFQSNSSIDQSNSISSQTSK